MAARHGAQVDDLDLMCEQDGGGEAPIPGCRSFWTDVSGQEDPVPHGCSVADDPLRLIKYPASALSDAQRARCDELHRRVQVKVDGDPRATRVSRRLLYLHDDPDCVRLLGELVGSLQGLPQGSALKLDHAPGSVEPTVLISRYLPDRQLKGACSAHQDDLPLGRPSRPSDDAKRLVFFLLMQKTEREQGPTFAFLKSHYIRKKKVVPASSGKGRRRRRVATKLGRHQVHPSHLVRDLTRKCGEPILLTGEKYTLYRMPASLWHGALPNHVERDRVVVGFAYCLPGAVGTNLVTKAGRMGK